MSAASVRPLDYLQVLPQMPQHPKTYDLAERLGIPRAFAAGLIVSLWGHAGIHYPGGDLSRCSARMIADACGVGAGDGLTPDELLEALRASGWIDEDGRLHDWLDVYGALFEKRDAERERSRQRRKDARGGNGGGRSSAGQEATEGRPAVGPRSADGKSKSKRESKRESEETAAGDASASPPAAAEPPAIEEIPLREDGEWFTVSVEMLEELERDYAPVEVRAELKHMRQHWLSKPAERRWARPGARRGITTWLAKERRAIEESQRDDDAERQDFAGRTQEARAEVVDQLTSLLELSIERLRDAVSATALLRLTSGALADYPADAKLEILVESVRGRLADCRVWPQEREQILSSLAIGAGNPDHARFAIENELDEIVVSRLPAYLEDSEVQNALAVLIQTADQNSA